MKNDPSSVPEVGDKHLGIKEAKAALGVETQNALKPCPFCGGQGELFQITKEQEPNNEGGWVIQCKGCKASSRVHFSEKDDARPHVRCAWNDRVASDPKGADSVSVPNEVITHPVNKEPQVVVAQGIQEKLEQVAEATNRKLCHNHYCGMDWDNLKLIQLALNEALEIKERQWSKTIQGLELKAAQAEQEYTRLLAQQIVARGIKEPEKVIAGIVIPQRAPIGVTDDTERLNWVEKNPQKFLAEWSGDVLGRFMFMHRVGDGANWHWSDTLFQDLRSCLDAAIKQE